MAKKTSQQVKKKPTEWEKIFVSDTFNRRAISKLHKEIKEK